MSDQPVEQLRPESLQPPNLVELAEDIAGACIHFAAALDVENPDNADDRVSEAAAVLLVACAELFNRFDFKSEEDPE